MIVRLRWFVLSLVFLCVFCGALPGCYGKPQPQDSRSQESSRSSGGGRESAPSSSQVNVSYPNRRLIASRTNDGFWSASARLPTSSESGGNEHSRYKIRRDGSLSLDLKTPSPSTASGLVTFHNLNNNIKTNNKLRPPSPITRHKESSSSSPSELRSFSVVLSDVDVVGRYDGKRPSSMTTKGSNKNNYNDNKYNENDYEQDSYSEAGVSGYHLHSNSIHRMNASWKLNPSNSSPTSEELLQFLSLFSANDEEEGSALSAATQSTSTVASSHNHHQPYQQQQQYHRNEEQTNQLNTKPHKSDDDPSSSFLPLLQQQMAIKTNGEHSHPFLKDVNFMPFSTWSESSRKLNSRANVVAANSNKSSQDTNVSTDPHEKTNNSRSRAYNSSKDVNGNLARVVLHDLISTLGKLNNENSENGTINLNLLNGNNRSQEDESRMKPTDPHQTANDLKKLMSLLVQAQQHQEADGTADESSSSSSGANVVNIVIAPEINPSNEPKTNNSQLLGHRIGQLGGAPVNTQHHHHKDVKEGSEKHKILFLKSPQVKQLLDTALSDPAVSSAAQKIAAALHVPPYTKIPSGLLQAHHHHDKQPSHKTVSPPNHLHNYLLEPPPTTTSNETSDSNSDDTAGTSSVTTPDGFPLTAAGFLNLHHPNLQFHQALHHLIANGTAPTSINATTKTNVINIFVLNFGKDHPLKTAFHSKHKEVLQHKEREPEHLQQRHPPSLLSSSLPQRIKTSITKGANSHSHSQQKPSNKFSHKSPFSNQNIQPVLIEKVQQSPILFFSKMGELLSMNQSSGEAAPNDTLPWHSQTTNNGYQEESSGHSTPAALGPDPDSNISNTTKPDRINILDLLPGDINSFTKVDFADPFHPLENDDNGGGGEDDEKEGTIINLPHMPPHIRPHNSSALQDSAPSSHSSVHNHHNYGDDDDLMSFISQIKIKGSLNNNSSSSNKIPAPELPPELSHLSWIFNDEPPPHPVIDDKKEFDTFLPDYDDPDFPEDSITFGNINTSKNSSNNNGLYQDQTTESVLDMYVDHDDYGETTIMPDDEATSTVANSNSNTTEPVVSTTKRVAFYAIRNNKPIKDPFTQKPATEPTVVGPNSQKGSDGSSPITTTVQNHNKVAAPAQKPVAAAAIPPGAVLAPTNNDRIRKLLTALGYSAIPTLAAGAAATWSYWIPLVATAAAGRSLNNNRQKRFAFNTSGSSILLEELLRNTTSSSDGHLIDSEKSKEPLFTLPPHQQQQQQHHLLSRPVDTNKELLIVRKEPILGTSTNSSSSSLLSPIISPAKSPDNSQMNKSTTTNNTSPTTTAPSKNTTETKVINSNFSRTPSAREDDREEDELESLSKWIKVEVITESSPTLTRRPTTTITRDRISSSYPQPNHSHTHNTLLKGSNNGAIMLTSTTTLMNNTSATSAAHPHHSSHTKLPNIIKSNNDTDSMTLLPPTTTATTMTTPARRRLPQDVPLLKNFLKNVLSNEWNISMPSTTRSPPVHLLLVPLAKIDEHSSSSSFTRPAKPLIDWITSNNYQFHKDDDATAKIRPSSRPSSVSVVDPPPSKNLTVFKPAGQDVSIIIGHQPQLYSVVPTARTTTKTPIIIKEEPQKIHADQHHHQQEDPSNNNNINEAANNIRKKKLVSIVEAEESYTSAALLPIWFPILFGNRKLAHHPRPLLDRSIY